MNGQEYVTKELFNETINPLKKEVDLIKTTLVGESMRGGIVHELTDIHAKINEMNTNLKHHCTQHEKIRQIKTYNRREHYVLYTSLITTFGLVLIKGIEYLSTLR